MQPTETKRSGATFRYLQLAMELEDKINTGTYKAGDKLPSLRRLHAQTGLSITTINQAYIELETRGLIEPRQKSGYYVRPLIKNILAVPEKEKYQVEPRKVEINSLAESLQAVIQDPDVLPFGVALPALELMPARQLRQSLKSMSARYFREEGLNYGPPSGTSELKKQIARRTLGFSRSIDEDEIIITNGCMDAIQLCLRAVAKPGDIIVTESPTFPCYLQLIEDMGMLALEIPTSPGTGIDLEALEKALAKHRVAACIFNPHFQNPLGFSMTPEQQKQLLAILSSRDIPIIEDDIYGDLYFNDTRPKTLKSMDRSGLVLYCSSFSKTLASDLRIGWTMPGQFCHTVRRLKFNSTITSPKLNQLIIADFLASGHYERHLRRFRNTLKNQVAITAQAIATYFPADTRLTAPEGGFILWLTLDKKINAEQLFHTAKREKIFIIPGTICSTTGRFANCLRISCGHPWNEKMEEGMEKLGRLVHSFHS